MMNFQRNEFPGLWACAALALIITGCATAPATNETSELDFASAVNVATDSLAAQTQKMPAFLAQVDAKLNKRGIVIDPMLDAASGQQTVATRQLEQRIVERLQSNYAQFEVLPFQTANLGKAQYLMTGTLTRIVGKQPSASASFQINLALTEMKTGIVVAQASSRARGEGLDMNPTPYYRDSPIILVKDKVVDGYIRTSATVPGLPADPVYFQRIAAATLVNDGTLAYNNEHYQDSLNSYRSAQATAAGDQLRVLNGIYLTTWRLGKTAEAEQAFGQVVALGLANNSLGVKFLFNPGTTDFWSDPKISGPYAFWLRQIAKQTAASKVCMTIVGHTSHSGSEALNDRLSQQRAAYIKQRLDSDAGELTSRTKATGMGYRENIVGTGTDDASDALDRRVEFRITSC
jgi:outer membrane protein OmpA-like peptidoglycan-associated protein